jgi:hypothetical protein
MDSEELAQRPNWAGARGSGLGDSLGRGPPSHWSLIRFEMYVAAKHRPQSCELMCAPAMSSIQSVALLNGPHRATEVVRRLSCLC